MHENLAKYASNPEKSKGRVHNEGKSFRDEFQRDTNRIINSASFRRLVYKTQVFVNDTGDHYRTRMTHSLEVAQIGKVIASALDLSTELTECLALAHDIGHPPFGHAGEEALNICMSEYGGFDHNEYTVKLLTELEERYLSYNGLNLCFETMDGIIKHNGPVASSRPVIASYAALHGIDLSLRASLEAQVASLSDDIAYNSHDLEDGLRAGFFSIDDVYDAGVICDIIARIKSSAVGLDQHRIIFEVIRNLINFLVNDVINTSKQHIKDMSIIDLEDVLHAKKNIISMSGVATDELAKLRKFLFANMYRHPEVNRMTYRAKKIVTSLYQVFLHNPDCLPKKWQNKPGPVQIVIADYIAGMTDRFATLEYEKLI